MSPFFSLQSHSLCLLSVYKETAPKDSKLIYCAAPKIHRHLRSGQERKPKHPKRCRQKLRIAHDQLGLFAYMQVFSRLAGWQCFFKWILVCFFKWIPLYLHKHEPTASFPCILFCWLKKQSWWHFLLLK